MEVRVGDRVLVNVAPFIASVRRCQDSVPCKVVEVAGTQVRIVTKCPLREVDLWVSAQWIDGKLRPSKRLSVPELA